MYHNLPCWSEEEVAMLKIYMKVLSFVGTSLKSEKDSKAPYSCQKLLALCISSAWAKDKPHLSTR
jgi:hypothetical protein